MTCHSRGNQVGLVAFLMTQGAVPILPGMSKRRHSPVHLTARLGEGAAQARPRKQLPWGGTLGPRPVRRPPAPSPKRANYCLWNWEVPGGMRSPSLPSGSSQGPGTPVV